MTGLFLGKYYTDIDKYFKAIVDFAENNDCIGYEIGYNEVLIFTHPNCEKHSFKFYDLNGETGMMVIDLNIPLLNAPFLD